MSKSYRLDFLTVAELELHEAAAWYNSQRRGLGHELLREVRGVTARLLRNPRIYAPIEEQVRRVFLKRFPYGIFYEVHGDEIVVIACMHESRDPEIWRSRMAGP